MVLSALGIFLLFSQPEAPENVDEQTPHIMCECLSRVAWRRKAANIFPRRVVYVLSQQQYEYV